MGEADPPCPPVRLVFDGLARATSCCATPALPAWRRRQRIAAVRDSRETAVRSLWQEAGCSFVAPARIAVLPHPGLSSYVAKESVIALRGISAPSPVLERGQGGEDPYALAATVKGGHNH